MLNIRDILRQLYGKRGFIFVHAIFYDNQMSSKQKRKKRFKLWKIKGIGLEGSLAGRGEL